MLLIQQDHFIGNIVGLKLQPIRSCLEVLDTLLSQSETVVSSYIPDDKNTEHDKPTNLVDVIANILGKQYLFE